MHTKQLLAVALLGFIAIANATVHFQENFDEGWEARWVKSKNKESEGTQGTWGTSAGKYYADANDKGLKTTEDARFYQISAAVPKFSNKDKDLIVAYTVKHEQNIDCGGGYIKLLPSGLDQSNFHGDSSYNIMFGPDICGSSTKRIHLIFNYKGKNHLWKRTVPCETDTYTHLYALTLRPDNTYKVEVDGKEVASGSLKDDWDMLPPKTIKDPNAKKPADWVDEKQIPDPEDKKPEGWDDIPAEIPDPNAKKPEDWDDELDGEWEAPMINNPDYKGEWKPKMIPNPAYKGEWVHPMIDNPDFVDDNNLYLYEDNSFLGFEIWQVKAGTIFDKILVTDDASQLEQLVQTVKKVQEGEKAMEKEELAKAEPEEVEEEEEENPKDEL